MTKDPDPTPPHGIPRPAPTALEAARAWLMDERQNASTIYSAEQLPTVLAPMETIADLLDIAEVFPALWHGGEADALEGIADDLARMADTFPDFRALDAATLAEMPCDGCGSRVLGWMLCPTAYKDSEPFCLDCCGCPEHEPEDSTPSGWERVKDAPAHPFGGAADR